MKIIEYPDKSQWKEILKRPSLNAVDLTETVRGILDKIRMVVIKQYWNVK